MTSSTTTTTCPRWCAGDHSSTIDPDVGVIVHESRPVATVDLHPGDPRSIPLSFAISADEVPGGAIHEPIVLVFPGIPDGLTVRQAQDVANALSSTLRVLAEVSA